MLKCASLTLTTSYQSIATILDAQTNKPYGTGRTVAEGLLRNTGSTNIRVSTGNVHANEGNDNLSVLLEPGDALPFSSLNLAATFVKTLSGTGYADFYGDE